MSDYDLDTFITRPRMQQHPHLLSRRISVCMSLCITVYIYACAYNYARKILAFEFCILKKIVNWKFDKHFYLINRQTLR